MKPLWDRLGDIAVQFSILSLLAFGGANAVVPEMHRQAVDLRHWMSGPDFAALFAIAQAAPGPNFLISTLVGWKAAGVPGALVATLALCGPSCILSFWIARLWDRYRDSRLRISIGAGLAPVAVGLVFASAYVLVQAAAKSWRLAAVSAVCAAIVCLTRLNPLWCLAAAAALGAAGVFS